MLLRDLTQERCEIKNLRDDIHSQLKDVRQHVQEKTKQLQKMSSEVDKDVSEGKKVFHHAIEQMSEQFLSKISHLDELLNQKQENLKLSFRKTEHASHKLAKVIRRAETLAQFFKSDLACEDLLKDIEMKKYDDARAMLAKGHSREAIAEALGLRSVEIDLLRRTA